MATLPGLSLIAPPSAGEGSAGGSQLFRFTVNKAVNVAPSCSVGWRVSGDVTAGDFVTGQELSGRLTIPANAAQGFIDLQILQDAVVEPNENLTVELFDPIGAILLQQPGHGTVTVSDTYGVIYTPAPGFVGTDTFNYMVKNSDSQVGTAAITVTVTGVTGPAVFPNGFEKKIEAFVGPDSEAMTGFEVLFNITDTRLRTQANGGVVRGATGQDIRLEDGAGNSVPYARLRYNAATGQIVGLAKRNRSTGTTWNNIEVYAGNTGTVVDEANPAAALSGLLACWRLDTGADISGNGRNLTLSTGMATGVTLFEAPAGSFVRASANQAELANPSSWLNGLAAFTLAMDLQLNQISADSGIFRTGGTVAGAENLCSIAVRPDHTSFYASPAVADFYYADLNISISGTPTLCRIEGSASSAVVGVPTTFALAWASGQNIIQVIDDAVITSAYNGTATPTGTLAVPDASNGKPLDIAAGPRGSFDGKVGLVRLASARRSNAWLKAEQRNRLYPHAVLSWGEAVGLNDTASCVAFPSTASASGTAVTLSPLATTPAAIGTGNKIVSATSERGATVALVGNPATTLTYTQPVGFTGTDHVTYTIQDSLNRQSVSLITVTVTGASAQLVVNPDTSPGYTTTGVAPVDCNVQANDSGTGRHITNVGTPAHGTAVKVGTDDQTAIIRYTPTKPWFGADTWNYTVTDSASTVLSAAMTVTTSRPPIQALADNAGSVTAGAAAITISPLANDTGVDLTITARDVPSSGTATITNNNTQISYLPPASVQTQTVVTFNYTATDAYSQTAIGTITVTVNPVAVTLPVANDDTYSATVGQAVFTLSPSPLANDTVVTGGTLTINALPNSGVGTGGGTFARVASNTGMSYNATSVANPVTDTINYTINDGTNTDVGVVSVNVAAVVTPSSRPKFPNSPTNAQKKRVTTSAQLTDAFSNANAGDHIQLDAGTYNGDFTFSRSFATGTPVVIEGPSITTSRPTAILTGQIKVSGVGIWLHHLTFNYSGSGDKLALTGNNINVTRCWFRDNGTNTNAGAGTDLIFPTLGGGHHCNINYNRFTSHGRSEVIRAPLPGGSTGLKADNHPHHTVFYRNYFWVTTSSSNGNENHLIYFGDAHILHRDDLGCMLTTFEENYFDNCQMIRTLYLKRAASVIRNRFRDVNQNIGFRHGHTGIFWGNRCETGKMIMNGWDNDIRGNVIGSGCDTQFDAGGCRPPPLTPGVLQACDNNLLVHNTGKFDFGYLGNHSLQPPFNTDVQPDDVAGGKINGVHIWEHQSPQSDITTHSAGVESGGVTWHAPGTAYTGDNIDPSRYATIGAGWDGDDTGFETGSSDQGSKT